MGLTYVHRYSDRFTLECADETAFPHNPLDGRFHMARWSIFVLGLLVAFAVGWIASTIVPSAFNRRVPTDWFEMKASATSNGLGADTSATMAVTYSFDAFAKADIPLPEIKGVKGTAKFVTDSSATRLGYKTAVEIAKLDLSKIPERYLQEKRIDVGGGKTLTELPIQQVHYEARFQFILKDKDGFTLLEIQSATHTLESGRTNNFQALAPDPISTDVASRTAEIFLGLGVIKCVTCG